MAQFPIKARIQVFVSSTIEECSEERKVAKKAVRSLNHVPFLFEDLGATPNPPRSEYLRLIERAHIFVGIYRASYGWVAPDTEISGVEDEFRAATHRGMPRLVYVLSDDAGRDERLCQLVDEIMVAAGVTVSFYDDEAELYERLRDDIAAVVAEQFYGDRSIGISQPVDPATALRGILPDPQKMLRRKSLEDDLLAAIEQNPCVQVYGDLGVGKTVQLATLAAAKAFIFVDVADLGEIEMIAAISNAFSGRLGEPVDQYLDREAALGSLLQRWDRLPEMTVVIDGLADGTQFQHLATRIGAPSSDRRIVYAVRQAEPLPGHTGFHVPSLSEAEVRAFLELQFGEITEEQVEEAYELSQGSLLYLRYYRPAVAESADLAAVELSSWKSLLGMAREIVGFVALAERPLTVEDIRSVAGNGDQGAAPMAALESAGVFLREQPGGFTLVHEHLRQTLRDYYLERPQQHLFYANRLAGRYLETKDPGSAYLVLLAAKDPRAPALAQQAIFDASRRWDLRRLRPMLVSHLEHLRHEGDLEGEVHALLSLAQVELNSAGYSSAQNHHKLAAAAAEKAGDQELKTFVREQMKIAEAYTSFKPQAIEELVGMRDAYEADDLTWSAARLTGELSSLWLRLDRHEDAAREARSAMVIFGETGDEYGVEIAKRNLASALTAMSGHDEELSALLEEISATEDPAARIRDRAWMANLLCRKFRAAGDYEKAREHASAAIAAAEELGDAHRIAINTLNLANVARDSEEMEEALALYESASAKANSAGDRITEASACRLAAGVCNAEGDFARAKQHAEYARALLQDTVHLEELSNALRELGVAERGLGNSVPAVEAYLEGARAAWDVNPEEAIDLALRAIDTLPDSDDSAAYVEVVERLFQGQKSTGSITERMLNLVPQIVPQLPPRRVIRFLGDFARHMFGNGQMSPALSRRVLELTVKASAGHLRDTGTKRKALLSLTPFLTAVPVGALDLSFLVELAEMIAEVVDDVYYKPHSDGAAHWTLQLQLTSPVILSVTQIDDRVDTALVTMLLVLFLKCFEAQLSEKIFGSIEVERRELVIIVANRAEVLAQGVPLEKAGGDMDQLVLVTRPTEPESDEQVPTVVTFRGELMDSWHSDAEGEPGLALLLGLTSSEMTFQLLRGRVDLDDLAPKIMSVVRQML